MSPKPVVQLTRQHGAHDGPCLHGANDQMDCWEQLRALESEEDKIQSSGEWLPWEGGETRKEVGGVQGLGERGSERRRVEKPPGPAARELERVANIWQISGREGMLGGVGKGQRGWGDVFSFPALCQAMPGAVHHPISFNLI